MLTVVHRFDCIEAFPVIEGLSSPGAIVETSLVGLGDDAAIDVKITRAPGVTGVLEAAIALPPRTVIGVVDRFELAVVAYGDACRAGLVIEDESTGAQRVVFEAADFVGPGVYAIDFADDAVRVMQWHRLYVILDGSFDSVRLGLVSLSYSGDARIGRAEVAR